MAANLVRAMSPFPKHLKELRLHLCQRSAASQGVRDFVENHYVDLKKSNPQFPFLIRECSGVEPKVWARYEFGRERNLPLSNMSSDQVAKALQMLAEQK
ncbi:NADH dehydrogenase [ubiquinone] 1 alpha subcomplex subunit 2-like [Branchiostoma floridae]|uniref:NADH dehydrogenase [ubiquinone] 1 alpha subcomplex subunit 2 n=2 Tax=Branchiostoma floridae TaxID=7739 RepID=A0A9J7LD67_BRAFL|nr:NADH dehydrogenase [ubiquinone] 1 alpha subcomplex subunit 2-like [Branchiostoma floridae]